MATKRKRADLTIEDKIQLLKAYDKLNLKDVSRRAAAKKLGIPPTSLCTLLNQRNEIISKHNSSINETRKRNRKGKCQIVEDALYQWYEQEGIAWEPITRSILKNKANELANQLNEQFVATDGWVSRWKERYNIRIKPEMSVDDEGKECLKMFFQDLQTMYDPEDIFNTIGTTFSYETPELVKTNNNCKRTAKVLLTCNIMGTIRKKPLIIEKIDKRCPRVEIIDPKNYMTNSLYDDFLKIWNLELYAQDKKVIFITSIRPNITLTNIEFIILPQISIDFLKSLQLDIVRIFRIHCRNECNWYKQSNIIDKSDIDLISLKSWFRISQSLIKKCYATIGFKIDVEETGIIKNESSLSDESSEEFENCLNISCDVEATPVVMVEKNISDEKEDQSVIVKSEKLETVTKEEALEAIEVLKRVLDEKSSDALVKENLYSLEKHVNKFFL